jgi:hypothetical protein
LAALTFVQASQKNYGLAAGTSTQFFSRARELADRAPDANGRKGLEDLLLSQDKITAELAKGDPGTLGDLQVLFEKTRQARGSGDRQQPAAGLAQAATPNGLSGFDPPENWWEDLPDTGCRSIGRRMGSLPPGTFRTPSNFPVFPWNART